MNEQDPQVSQQYVPTSDVIYRDRMKRLVLSCMVILLIFQIPAILFAVAVSRENTYMSYFQKTQCTLVNSTVEQSTCTNCNNGGCFDQRCFIPTFEVHSNALPDNVTALIRMQGRFEAAKALKDLDHYKLNKDYKCYTLKDEPYVIIWAPRHFTGYAIGAAFSWIVVIIALILIIVGLVIYKTRRNN